MSLSKSRKTKGKQKSLFISTVDARMNLKVEPAITGNELFETVCRAIGLRETWFFGLQYTNKKGRTAWFRPNKKVFQHDLGKDNAPEFQLLVKFYPEDVGEELTQEVTQHLFFLQVKQGILSGDLICPPENAVLLATYALQAKFGNFEEKWWDSQNMSMEELLPLSVREQYRVISAQEWKGKMKRHYADHSGLNRSEAEMEYLKVCQHLDMFGVTYFDVKNKKGDAKSVGVDAMGVNMYPRDNRQTAETVVPWSHISNIATSSKRFTVKMVDKSASNVVFVMEKAEDIKQLLELCLGNHELYLRRRKPDTLEVQHMKQQAEEQRRRRELQRQRERSLRDEGEKEKQELTQQVQQLQHDISLARMQMSKSEETADLWAERWQLAEEEKALVSEKAVTVEAELGTLHVLAVKAQEEKLGLEHRVRETELLATRVVEDSERRVATAQRLQEELLQARLAEQTAKEKLRELVSGPPHAVNPQSILYTAPSYTDLYDEGQAKDVDLQYPDSGADMSCDLIPCDMELLSKEIEKERVEYLVKSKHLQAQLKELRSEIEVMKVEEQQQIVLPGPSVPNYHWHHQAQAEQPIGGLGVDAWMQQ